RIPVKKAGVFNLIVIHQNPFAQLDIFDPAIEAAFGDVQSSGKGVDGVGQGIGLLLILKTADIASPQIDEPIIDIEKLAHIELGIDPLNQAIRKAKPIALFAVIGFKGQIIGGPKFQLDPPNGVVDPQGAV